MSWAADLGNTLARAGVAAQLDRNPMRQLILLELVTRPWGALPPPWVFAPHKRRAAIEEYYEERAAIGQYERNMTREEAQAAALELVVANMQRANLWPAWFDLAAYERSRERVRRRLGL